MRTIASFAIIVLALAVVPGSALAANIKVVEFERFDDKANGSIDVDSGLGFNLGQDGEFICNVALEGPIVRGDLDLLKQLLAPLRPDTFDHTPRLCLDSPGGSYSEGLAIAQYLMENNVGTAIAGGAKCYSACSLIFMGGTFPWKGQINRFLHAGGVLGFHAPYIPDRNKPGEAPAMVDEGEVRAAFSDGIRAMSSFMQMGVGNEVKRIVPELMAEMMAQGPDQFFYVDTVGKAIRFRIGLFGIGRVPPVDDPGICNACVNMNYFALESYGAGEENDLCKGLEPGRRKTFPAGVRVTNDVAPRGGECSVDLVAERGRLKQWMYLNDERNPFGDGLELAYWYLYPPNAKLADLAGATAVPAPQVEVPPMEEPKPGPGTYAKLAAELEQFVIVDYLGEGKPGYETRPELYADRVVYYDQGEIAREGVIADQRRHYKRWSKRRYVFIRDTLNVTPADDENFDISFRYTFEVGNGKLTKVGSGLTRLGIARQGGRFVVVREDGEVDKTP